MKKRSNPLLEGFVDDAFGLRLLAIGIANDVMC